jgi:hypothetical protein
MDEPLPDPVEDFLLGIYPARAEVAFRQALLARTSRFVRGRRWRRRFLNAAALAACFLAGAACVHWLRQPAAPPETAPLAKVTDQSPAPSTPAPEQTPKVPAAVAAIATEWNAFDDRGRKRELYRQAGDLYVQENHDYESALRCYTQALEAGSDQDLAITPDDNWLLMALKEARQKEKNDARTGG